MDDILSYSKKPEDDYYVILGCDDMSSMEQILAEYKIRALACHPDKHLDDQHAVDKFARLQQAKATLCDPEKRRDYDSWKNSGLAISYGDWKARKNSIHTSMHWAVRRKTEPMLEEAPKPTKPTVSIENLPVGGKIDTWAQSVEKQWVPWYRSPADDSLRKFRNYEI